MREISSTRSASSKRSTRQEGTWKVVDSASSSTIESPRETRMERIVSTERSLIPIKSRTR